METMERSVVIKFLILRTIGNFLVLFALFGVGATFGPAVYVEINFRIDQLSGVHYAVADTVPVADASSSGQLAQMNTHTSDQLLIPKDTEFGIVIPKIGANAKVFPNIDPSNEKEYLAVLAQGVAHAKGTVFPGLKGVTYLFAHSTDNWWNVGRYNAVFYLLKDMDVNDSVVMFFKNIRYNYVVIDKKIVDGNDTSYLTDAQNGGPERLVLQTCWPPGTTLKRILVVAKRVGQP